VPAIPAPTYCTRGIFELFLARNNERSERWLPIQEKASFLMGPKLEIFGSGVSTQIRTVWVGDLGTRPKNPKMGWFMPENCQFVLFSAVGFNPKDFLTL
jgi:hypothetical protein